MRNDRPSVEVFARNQTREDGIGCGRLVRGDQGRAGGGSWADGEGCGGVVRIERKRPEVAQ